LITPAELLTYRFFDLELAPGHVVLPVGEHIHKLSPAKQAAELTVRAGDPRGALRANAIFVYEDRRVALELLSKTPGEHLYELVVRHADVVSRCDLRIYDEIVDAIARREPTDGLVREFWSGAEREEPRIELTTLRAIIARKLVDDADKPG
jgi:hypothetical protein